MKGHKEIRSLFLHYQPYISQISKLELLFYPLITPEEEDDIRDILTIVPVIPINEEIEENAVKIRRIYKTKLMDSIIAATSLSHHIPLITADKGFKKIKEINLIHYNP